MIKNIMSFIKKNYLWIILSVCLIITLNIAEDIFEQEIMKCDTIAYNIFDVFLRNYYVTIFMKAITNLGSALVLISISILSFIFIKNKKFSLCIFLNLIFITISNQALKFVVQRPRPKGYRLIAESGYSFPSGHSMISMAFYGFLIYLAYAYIKNKNLKWTICIALSLLILLIGTSRIYLGVHYASDVIGGFLISISYLIIYIKIINRYILNTQKYTK